MAHKSCRCGADMWDADGHIVYDIYFRKDIEKYINSGKENYTFNDMYGEHSLLTEECSKFLDL